jgi:biopolymer transport protein ExbD
MATRLNHDDDLEETHEINVTPFIDVMLVLLIIFMVAAPLATVDVKVDLPASTAQPQPKPDKQVFLSIKADGQMVLGEQPVTHDGLAAVLKAATNGDQDQRVFVRADKSVTYETIMEAMNDLRGAGYLKVALVGIEETPGTLGAQ